MIDKNLLEDMSQISIKEMAADQLSDILDIKIHGETAVQRLESYLAQVGNPYCFRVGNTPVRISFKSGAETLDKKIRSHFLGLKIR